MVSADKEQEKGNFMALHYGSVVKELDIVHNQSECRKDYIVFKWSNQSVGVSSKKQRMDN